VTLNPQNNQAEVRWNSSPSPDVAGYVVYLYKDGEGYYIDTIFNPAATTYSVFRPGTGYFSESYVVAAIDSSDNTSPLSNELRTIFVKPSADTCNNRINVTWNKYLSIPVKVTGYDVFVSVNSGTYYLAGHVSDQTDSFMLENIENSSEYCIIVKAALENGMTSVSNKTCLRIRVQKNPDWINADYATVNDENEISLAFSVDPFAETDLFSLERRSGYSGPFQELARITGNDPEKVFYTDKDAKTDIVNFYRLAAINSCDIKVKYSNTASNISLINTISGNEILLKWNNYRSWAGSAGSFRISADTGNGFSVIALKDPGDTTLIISIPDLMYGLKEGRVCFHVGVTENDNPYGITGETRSDISCAAIDEVVTVPNIFSPDGDLKNDLFRPVITFTPAEYLLVISDRQGKVLFETRDFMESWNGKNNGGEDVREGVYLWFLRIKTGTGKNISRTGTVTLINR
jgi:gliding motility-associated-like protein